MLHEFGSPVDKVIGESLDILIDGKIIPGLPRRRSVLTEYALRNSKEIKRQIFSEESVCKIKTLFGVRTKADFYGPRRQQIIDETSLALKNIQLSFPDLQGILLFGSRMDDQKTPRNNNHNPSDIDALAIFYKNIGNLSYIEIRFKEELSLYCRVFNRIPFNLKMAGTVESFNHQLNPRNLTQLPYWATNPHGAYYIGEMTVDRRRLTQAQINQNILTAISSPPYQDLRIQKIHQLYSQSI